MRCTAFCITWASRHSSRDRSIPKPIRLRKKSSKKIGEQLAEIPTQHPDRRLKVYHEDEARFGQQGTITRVWARVGSRPRAVKQTQYGFVYVLAATCAETGAAEGLIAPRLDAAIVNLFLAQLSRTLEPDVQAVLVWDGAGYHVAKALVCPANITLVVCRRILRS